MYDAVFERRLYQLYVVHGKNEQECTRILRKDYPSLSGNTTRKYIVEGRDELTGETWDEARKSIQVRSVEMIAHQGDLQRATILDQISELRKSAYEMLIAENRPEAKTLEGLMYAYKSLAQTELKLLAEGSTQVDPMIGIHLVLEVLSEDPEGAEFLGRKWPKFHSVITKRLREVMEAKDITP